MEIEKKAIDSINHNPKYFYSYEKKFSKTKSKIGPLEDPNTKPIERKK